MNGLILLAASFMATDSWLRLLLQLAIICVVVWAAIQLLAWSGITLPRPVQIILYAALCIILILWLFRVLSTLI